MAALSLAWLGLGRSLAHRPPPSLGHRRVPSLGHRPAPSLKALRLVGLTWCLPLLLAPALFSRDAYSYLAQGTILHLGLSPYHQAPAVLGSLGHQQLLASVAPFWRHTTAPYGPLFLGLVSLVVGATSKLIAGVLLLRLAEVAALALLAYWTPRLARALGADPVRATWLVVLSPLVLLELIVPAHNDVLMAALMVAGVTLAVERRPLAGVLVCALAAAIKLPAAAAVLFIAVAWAREQPTAHAKAKVLGQAGIVVLGLLLLVSAIPGVGWHWLSSSLFSTPQRVRLAITPATGLGWTAAALLRHAGVVTNARHLEAALGVVAFGLVALAGAALLTPKRRERMVPHLGMFLLAAALGGPAAWPWYLIWGIALLAACPRVQRARLIALVLAASPFLVKANGVLALPLQSAPAVLVFYLAVGWYAWRRRPSPREPDTARDAPELVHAT
jgi:hypothetical protein